MNKFDIITNPPKYCRVKDMNFEGEIMKGEFDGTWYVLQDGDCYFPESLLNYDPEFLDKPF